MARPKFILASASPARRRLLQIAGIEPIVQPSDFDESQVQTSDPKELVQALALHKAEAVISLLDLSREQPALILGCDSILVVQDEIHGKPANAAEAIARWQRMRGQVGELFTGHALLEWYGGTGAGTQSRSLVRCQITRVHFANISDRQIAAYVATGEPLQCAGCFALEGKGGLFVERLEGCHSNVIGLSLPLLRQMLGEWGYDITNFWPSEL